MTVPGCKSTLTHTPTVYGCRHIDMMLTRWNGELGGVVRRYGSSVWPGTPAPALVGFSANTTSSSECVLSAGFYEIGYYNTPAGRVQSGDTNCAYAGQGGTWQRLGASQSFVNLVGRAGATSNWRSDITSQGVIGMMDYAEKARYMSGQIPTNVRPTRGSQWEYLLGAMGYVSGGLGPARLISAHPELASVPEAARFGALARIALETNASGVDVCYPMVRAWERLSCGWLLAGKIGQPTAWFDVHLGTDRMEIEYQLTRRWILATGCADEGRPDSRYYQSCGGVNTSGGYAQRSGTGVGRGGGGDFLTLLLAAGIAYGAYEYMQPKRAPVRTRRRR